MKIIVAIKLTYETMKLFQLLILAAAVLPVAVKASVSEATIDSSGNVITASSDDDGAAQASIPKNEQLSTHVTNKSPFRCDIYWDDGEYGSLISTLDEGESSSLNTFVGHKFFVTRHGVKEGLFVEENRLIFEVSQRDQQFFIPENAAPSTKLCQDRFSVCKEYSKNGGCERSPGWMIVHCCESCDEALNASELIDPKKRCSKENLNTPDPVWEAGDLNKLFESWASNQTLKDTFGLEVLSSPEPSKHGASWEKAAEGAPWVVVFNDFLTDSEVADLIRGGEIEGFERSTDQGKVNEVGEMEKVVSRTRTSSNAWCMHQCERLPGVKSATKKVEEITGIPYVNYESFQLLKYGANQFYRSHHDSSSTDDTPAGHRILTFFLYLTDVEEGGETYFNRLDLAVKPKKGKALVWPSVRDDNPHYWDSRMFHEAKDVIKGKKMAANFWIHLNDYHTPNDWGCTGSFS